MEVFNKIKDPNIWLVIVAVGTIIIGWVTGIFSWVWKRIFPDKKESTTTFEVKAKDESLAAAGDSNTLYKDSQNTASADNSSLATTGDGNTTLKDSQNTTTTIINQGIAPELFEKKVEEVVITKQELKVTNEKLQFTELQLTEIRGDIALKDAEIADIKSKLEAEREKNLVDSKLKLELNELDRLGQYEEAERLVEREIVEKGKMELAAAYFQQSGYAMLQLKYEKAKALAEAAIKLQPKNSLYLIQTGYLNSILGNYATAKQYYEEALNLNLLDYEKNKAIIAISYNNLGAANNLMGNYKEAISIYEKALKLNLEVHGEKSSITAINYNNLGSVYRSMEDFNNAKIFFEKALKIDLEILGENHTDIAIIYNNLGSIENGHGNYSVALDYFEKSLKINTEKLGENDPAVAASYNNIGSVFQSMGKYNQALDYYKKALKMHLVHLGENHPSVAKAYSNIGGIFFIKNDYKNAKIHGEIALRIFTNQLGEDHPDTIKMKKSLKVLKTSKK